MRAGCLVLGFLTLAAAAAAAVWLHHEITTPYYGGPQAETYVEVPRGASTGTIATLLTEARILHRRLPFILYLRWIGAGAHLQAGEYRFAATATPVEVAGRLLRGDVYFRSLTLPEGLTAAETVELVASSGLGDRHELERVVNQADWVRDLAPQARSLEGFLFPDTYRFGRRASSEEIVRAMVDRFRGQFSLATAETPIPPSWNAFGIVILASLVEKEVKLGEERPLVASVLTNRLRAGMPLACDPTIIYALKLAGRWDGNIRKPDLSLNSPYNTYVRPGLPPTPVANPGAASLRAALAPAPSDYYYFVAKNDGSHQFSRDYRSHQAAVARYQKRGNP